MIRCLHGPGLGQERAQGFVGSIVEERGQGKQGIIVDDLLSLERGHQGFEGSVVATPITSFHLQERVAARRQPARRRPARGGGGLRTPASGARPWHRRNSFRPAPPFLFFLSPATDGGQSSGGSWRRRPPTTPAS